jgi:hypothetical protein
MTMTAQDRELHHQADIELTEREFNMVSGGDGPPSTAGDGNGRAMHRVLQVQKYLDKASVIL